MREWCVHKPAVPVAPQVIRVAMQVVFFSPIRLIFFKQRRTSFPSTAPHQFCVIRSAKLPSRGTEGVKRVIAFKLNTVGKRMRSTWSINHIGTNQLPANWKMKRRRWLQPPPPPTQPPHPSQRRRRRAKTRARRLLSVKEQRVCARSAALHVPSNKSVGRKREEKNTWNNGRTIFAPFVCIYLDNRPAACSVRLSSPPRSHPL